MIYTRFGAFVDRCESPIERLFLVGLLFMGEYTFDPFERPPIIARDGMGVELGQQVRVDGYRIDFTLSHPEVAQRFAIELDGFVHHGSTPEQFEKDSARQRALTAKGWTVIRFSGREVRRDPRKCAAQAMGHAAALVDQIPKAGADVRRPEKDPDLVAQIRSAEARGDWGAAVTLAKQVEASVMARRALRSAGE